MRSNRMQMAAAAVALLTLVGCMAGQDPVSSGDRSFGERVVSGERSKFEANLKIWKARTPSWYYIDINMNCFCDPMGRMEVGVKEGQVVEAHYMDRGPDDTRPEPLNAPSIDGLFEMIGSYLDNPDYEVKVEYHKGLGYPKDISFRRCEPMPDGDVNIVVEEIKIPVES